MSKQINLLSLDGALRYTGALTIELRTNGSWTAKKAQIIKTEKTKNKKLYFSIDYFDRARKLTSELSNIIKNESIQLICSEAPSGSQSSSAAYSGGITIATQAAISAILQLKVIYATEAEVKVALCNSKKASKTDMMRAAYEALPQTITTGYVSKRSRNGFIGEFEHIADSFGVFLACKPQVLDLLRLLV